MNPTLSPTLLTSVLPASFLRAANPEEGLHLVTRIARAVRALSAEEPRSVPAAMVGYLKFGSNPEPVAPLASLVLSSFATVAAANGYWL